MFPSPALPLEVIERVIDHTKDIRTLYSFTLACRDLRPRSTILLFARVTLKTRDQLFALCATLQTKAHLQPCVRSVSIPAYEFSPHPLLRLLPNISEIVFTRNWGKSEPSLTFHPSILACCRQSGQHIRTLSFQNLSFSSISAFSNILLSLPEIESLSCASLHVKDASAPQQITIRRLPKRLHLRTLTIGGDNDNKALTLLKRAAKHSLVALAYIEEESIGSDPVRKSASFERLLLATPLDWVHLSSFSWRVPAFTWRYEDKFKSSMGYVIRIFNDFRPANLREVTVDFCFCSFRELLTKLLPSVPDLCTELEEKLLTFPNPTLSFSLQPRTHVLAPARRFDVNSRRYHSWMPLLGKSFPALVERRALTINAESSGQAGHDAEIGTPIVTSTDSRWAATGSRDGTIIVWDLDARCLSHEWYAHDTGVDSLAFSPDGRYLLSASASGKVKTLMEEGGGDGLTITNCAWSPDGSWIAAENGAVHIWETTTFQRLHVHSTAWTGVLLAFSGDGRWIVTGSGPCRFDRVSNACWIWSVESGKLHRSLRGHTASVCSAAFDLGATRVVTGSEDSTIRIWAAETGEQLLVLEEQARRWIDAVAFSGDGRMVLSHSRREDTGFARHPTDDYSGGAKVWDASNGAMLACLSETRADSESTPHTACFSPCGRYIASVSHSLKVLLWRTSDWSCIATVSGEEADVTHVAISPDGRVLCWGTEDGRVFFRRMHDLVSFGQD